MPIERKRLPRGRRESNAGAPENGAAGRRGRIAVPGLAGLVTAPRPGPVRTTSSGGCAFDQLFQCLPSRACRRHGTVPADADGAGRRDAGETVAPVGFPDRVEAGTGLFAERVEDLVLPSRRAAVPAAVHAEPRRAGSGSRIALTIRGDASSGERVRTGPITAEPRGRSPRSNAASAPAGSSARDTPSPPFRPHAAATALGRRSGTST